MATPSVVEFARRVALAAGEVGDLPPAVEPKVLRLQSALSDYEQAAAELAALEAEDA